MVGIGQEFVRQFVELGTLWMSIDLSVDCAVALNIGKEETRQNVV